MSGTKRENRLENQERRDHRIRERTRPSSCYAVEEVTDLTNKKRQAIEVFVGVLEKTAKLARGGHPQTVKSR